MTTTHSSIHRQCRVRAITPARVNSIDLAALALCSTVMIAGGCDREGDESPAATQSRSLEATPGDCLVDAKIVVHQKDEMVVSTDIAQTLQTVAQPGDLVELSFGLAPQCVEGANRRMTLVSYTRSQFHFGFDPPTIDMYDVDIGSFGEEGGTLSVRLPPCAFTATLAFGAPIADQKHPDDTYAGQGRLIVEGAGGEQSCEAVPELRVEHFDAAGRAWGEAPLTTYFGWKIAATGDKLSCSFDLDDDGQMDLVDQPCPPDSSDSPLAELTKTKYTEPGKYQPGLLVSDGTRRTWARTTVYSNRIDFQPHVRFPEKVPGFLEAAVYLAPPPAASTVQIAYTDGHVPPFVQVGQIVIGFSGVTGYMLKVDTVKRVGQVLTLTGHPVELADVVAGGFYGVRDYPISMEDAHCASPKCAGSVVTPVDLPPGGAPVILKPGDQPTPERKLGVKVALPIKDGSNIEVGELEFFAGLLIKAFELEFGFLSVKSADVQIEPMVEGAVTAQAALSDVFDIGSIVLGPLPAPLPILMTYSPQVELEAAAKFTAKAAVSAPFKMRKDANGWTRSLDPTVSASAGDLVPGNGQEAGIEVKATSIHRFALGIAKFEGPWVAPTLAVLAKGMFDQACDYCVTGAIAGGVTFGWESPLGGDLFEPLEIEIAESEFLKLCTPYEDSCEPPPAPPSPPTGGSWGDVHLISHDGLLFDFQAGGEFVLVRSTDPGDPLEVQTRQEPLKRADFTGSDLSVSINTAVATVVDGRRVALYTRYDDPVLVDGSPATLLPGALPITLGQGSLALDASGRVYTITYPTGEILTATRQLAHGADRAHFNVAIALAPGRAGAVEGLLGDADGDIDDDIMIGGGGHLPQPVEFEDLYHADVNFADAWRVTAEQSLFDYAAGASAATFLAYPYAVMPANLPPAIPPHAGVAQDACEVCPVTFLSACLTDVGSTGDASLATACTEVPTEPIAEMPTQKYHYPLYPLPHTQMTCDRQELLFRAPGAAQADIDSTLVIELSAWEEYMSIGGIGWTLRERFRAKDRPAEGWGDKFKCRDLGSGWGECTLKLDPETGPCSPPEPGNISDRYLWRMGMAPEVSLPFKIEFRRTPPANG